MKYVRLSLTQDAADRNPMHEFVVAHDGYEVSRLLQINYGSAEGFAELSVMTALFHVVGSPVEPYEAALQTTDSILEYELSPRHDDSFYLYVRSEHTEGDQRLIEPLRQQGLVAFMPVEYRGDGTVRITLVGPSESVQRALDDMPAEIGVDVLSIGEYDASYLVADGDLTDRQYEAVRAAVDCGYYAEPREGGVADVADRLDCSSSTAAEHLRRAEAAVMADLVDDRP